MQIIFAGSRSLTPSVAQFDQAYGAIGPNIDPKRDVIRLGAHWEGVDEAAKLWAKGRGMKIQLYPAPWGTMGRPAGPYRNRQMATMDGGADYLVAFWDGNSQGTLSMMSIMQELTKPATIYTLTPNGTIVNVNHIRGAS